MNIDSFFISSPEELIMCLEDYQQDLVNALLAETNNDYEKAADLWLSATPSQTAGFGGDTSHLKIYRDKIVDEIEKFVCGNDNSYQRDKEILQGNANATQQYIIGVLSTAIGGQLGVAGAFIAPIIVLLVISFGKISINAWCEMRRNDHKYSE
jgi:hypothetical protein